MIEQTPIFDKKNVIVTGGAGFLGSHLCERLLREAKVICMDDLSNSNIRNIEHLLQYPDFEFIKTDVNNPIDLDSFPELEKFKVRFQGVQEIYHLACPMNPKQFDAMKMQSLWANSRSMISTLDLAVKYRAKYLFSSSSVVYGNAFAQNGAFTEEQEGIVNHMSSRACYDEGKRFAETSVATYRQVHNLDAKIARIFNTYGPRMKLRDGLLVPDLILDALEGRDLEIHGDLEQKIPLCYVSDTIDGMIRLMHAGSDTWLTNIGNDVSISMNDLASRIIAMTGSSSQISMQPPLEFGLETGIPDLRKAKEKLGWMPLVRLDDGLKKIIDYTIANKEAMGYHVS